MSTHEPQRQLLFGLLAFQNGMIDRTQLLNAVSAWMSDKNVSIDEWLVTNDIVTATNREAIQRIVDQHIERFGSDLSKSFAEESDDTASLRRELEQLSAAEAPATDAPATDAEAKHALTVLSANPASKNIETKLQPLSSEQALAETEGPQVHQRRPRQFRRGDEGHGTEGVVPRQQRIAFGASS